MKQIIGLFCLLWMATGQADAQRLRERTGNVAVLQDVRSMNVQYVYEGMTVGSKYMPEEEYLQENRDRLNDKRPGKGRDWAIAWRNDRSQKFEPQFESAFEQTSGIHLGHLPDARYTLVFRTTHMETGYNIRIKRKSAFIDGELSIVETDHPDHIIAGVRITDCKGRSFDGYDFAANLRLMESYAKAGEAAGRFVKAADR